MTLGQENLGKSLNPPSQNRRSHGLHLNPCPHEYEKHIHPPSTSSIKNIICDSMPCGMYSVIKFSTVGSYVQQI